MEKINIYTNKFRIVFLLIIILEILSFWANNIDLVNDICFFVIVIATFTLSLKNIKWGFWIVSTELIIGSFGQLFSYHVNEFSISIRLAIFLAIFLAFIINSIKTKTFAFYKNPLWKYLLLLLTFLTIGVLLGLSSGNMVQDVFFDFNGYLYFGLIFIAFAVIKSWNEVNDFLQILFASILTMTLKTLFLVFYFSHVFNESLINLVYRWIRDTRVGEIAQILDNYYRIFFQSHIWSVIAFIIIAVYLIYVSKKEISKKNYIWAWIILIASSLNIIISFSRSFWLALFITSIGLLLFFYFKEKFRPAKIVKIIGIFLLIIILDLLLITGIVNVKIPSLHGSGDSISIAQLIKDRVSDTDEAAVTSRYELIKPLTNKFIENPIIGSGFGTKVTYNTNDPRSKGIYSTYSFEWGFLDILVKVGILGLIIYLLFIYKVFKLGINALKSSITIDSHSLMVGLLFSIILIIITHITTPYLNHPLGIFLIIISASIFSIYQKNQRK